MRFLMFVIGAMLGAMLPLAARAEVAPAVIDLQGRARDILSGAVTITNTLSHKATFYPMVENIDPATGRAAFTDPSRADLSSSLANWIEVSRGGVELWAGESRTIPFEVRVNLTARPGRYHAALLFPSGSTRAEAEAGAANAPGTTVNLEVVEALARQLNIRRFAPAHRFVASPPAVFQFTLENTGDAAEVPQGMLFLYDRTGAERGAVPVNVEGRAIASGEAGSFEVAWQDAAVGPGSYKAMLALRYGATGEVQDTVFFWIVPWFVVALLLGGTFAGIFLLAWWLHRRASHGHVPRSAGARGILGALTSRGIPHVVDLRHPDHHAP